MHRFGLTTDELSSDVACVSVAGELDYARAYLFDAEVRAVEARSPAVLVLDLRRLHFLDSTGLSRILAAHKRARRDQRRLVVVRGGSAVQRVFAMTAMDAHLEMVSDPQSALAMA